MPSTAEESIPELLARLEREHAPCEEDLGGIHASMGTHCGTCEQSWRCDVARLVAHARSLEAAQGGSPCLIVEPCQRDCSCSNPVMSGGCGRCARYGSFEQRKAHAEYLAALGEAQ